MMLSTIGSLGSLHNAMHSPSGYLFDNTFCLVLLVCEKSRGKCDQETNCTCPMLYKVAKILVMRTNLCMCIWSQVILCVLKWAVSNDTAMPYLYVFLKPQLNLAT